MSDAQVQFIEGRNGSTDLAILVRDVKLRRAPGVRMHYMIASSESSLPAKVMCDGVPIRPKMILKVYCKPKQKQREAVINRILADRTRTDLRRLLPGAK